MVTAPGTALGSPLMSTTSTSQSIVSFRAFMPWIPTATAAAELSSEISPTFRPFWTVERSTPPSAAETPAVAAAEMLFVPLLSFELAAEVASRQHAGPRPVAETAPMPLRIPRRDAIWFVVMFVTLRSRHGRRGLGTAGGALDPVDELLAQDRGERCGLLEEREVRATFVAGEDAQLRPGI